MYNLYAIQQYLLNPHLSIFSFFLSTFNFFDDNHYTLDFLPIHIILTHMRKAQVNHFSFGHMLLFKFFISLQSRK